MTDSWREVLPSSSAWCALNHGGDEGDVSRRRSVCPRTGTTEFADLSRCSVVRHSLEEGKMYAQRTTHSCYYSRSCSARRLRCFLEDASDWCAITVANDFTRSTDSKGPAVSADNAVATRLACLWSPDEASGRTGGAGDRERPNYGSLSPNEALTRFPHRSKACFVSASATGLCRRLPLCRWRQVTRGAAFLLS
ncbi:hypothetical protein MRX96_009773 [Rhipicephalus microplus]